jgi:hypothetical protein
MHSTAGLTDSRRRFLRYLALSSALASPLLIEGPLRKAPIEGRDLTGPGLFRLPGS